MNNNDLDGKRKLDNVFTPEPIERKHRQVLQCIKEDTVAEEVFVGNLYSDNDITNTSFTGYDDTFLDYTKGKESYDNVAFDTKIGAISTATEIQDLTYITDERELIGPLLDSDSDESFSSLASLNVAIADQDNTLVVN